MGMMDTITDSRTSSRTLFTILAVVALLGAQLATLGAGAASADTSAWTVNRVILEFGNDSTFDSDQEPGALIHKAGPDFYLWHEGMEGNVIHLSCSNDLTEDPGTVRDRDDEHDLDIVDFYLDADNPGGQTPGEMPCGNPDLLPEPEDPAPTDPAPTVEVDARCPTPGEDPVIDYTVDLDGADEGTLELDGETHTITADNLSGSLAWPADDDGPLDPAEVAITVGGESDTTSVDLIECPAEPDDAVSGIALAKAADQTSLVDPDVGDEVNYTFTITNTGQDALSGTELVDAIYDGLADLGDHDEAGFDLGVLTELAIDDADGLSLAVDEQLVLADAYTHAVTQDDIDRGGLYNVATVIATGDESGDEVSATDDELVTITTTGPGALVETDPDIAIVKAAVGGVQFDDTGTPYVDFAAEETVDITYEYEITNTGDEDLTDLSLVDDQIGDLGEAFRAEVGDGPFAAGELVTVTAVHEGLTVEDFDEGTLTNVAVVTGIGSQSGQTVSDDDTEVVFDVEVLADGVAEEDEAQVAEEDGTEVADEVRVAEDDETEVADETLPRTGLDSTNLLLLGILFTVLGVTGLLLAPHRRGAPGVALGI